MAILKYLGPVLVIIGIILIIYSKKYFVKDLKKWHRLIGSLLILAPFILLEFLSYYSEYKKLKSWNAVFDKVSSNIGYFIGWNIIAILGIGIVIVYLRKNIKKDIKNRIESDLYTMNREVFRTLQNYTDAIDETEIIIMNITIYSAFYCYYHKKRKEQDAMFNYISEFTKSLSYNLSIDEENILSIKNRIIRNKTSIENSLITQTTIKGSIDFLTKIIIEECSDQIYSKSSQLTLEISAIISESIIKVVKE